MTQRKGDDSPTCENADTCVETSSESVNIVNSEASVSPLKKLKEDASLCIVSGQAVVQCGLSTGVGADEELLAPAMEGVSGEEEERFEGETFEERMTRLGIAEGNPARRVLETEFKEACAAARREAEFVDDDGAVVFEPVEEYRGIRLPPGVPVPSDEIVRRHRAAGHTPYRPWCSCCVEGAANAPPHKARADNPIGDVPELHSDYGFFRDRKGDKDGTVTVLVTKDRKTTGVCVHMLCQRKELAADILSSNLIEMSNSLDTIGRFLFAVTVSPLSTTC